MPSQTFPLDWRSAQWLVDQQVTTINTWLRGKTVLSVTYGSGEDPNEELITIEYSALAAGSDYVVEEQSKYNRTTGAKTEQSTIDAFTGKPTMHKVDESEHDRVIIRVARS